MIKWTYCKYDIPQYVDLVKLARVINYNKRRMMSIMIEPQGNGYSDMFAAQEAINNYTSKIEELGSEYRYMILMHLGGRRMA